MNHKNILPILMLSLLAAACGPASPRPQPTRNSSPVPARAATLTPLPSSTPTSTSTGTPTLIPTPTRIAAYPTEGYGPTVYPAGVDPLIGLAVGNPALLARRPMAIKISNEPRNIRPQWGLDLADIVFDYYTESGATRFIALFYGNDASMVGPIRSARFFDANVIDGYKAIFAFGGADVTVLQSLQKSDFNDRLVVEGPASPITIFDPNGLALAVTNTSDLSAYITQKGIENGQQDLNGMSFQLQPPAGGQPVTQLFIRYSGESYDRWNYDAASGRYLRSEDTFDDPNMGASEHYAPLTDRLTDQTVAADNVIVLYATHQFYRQPSPGKNEIINILLTGSGPAYAFRDGQVYRVNWQRPTNDSVVFLTDANGRPFPFKPGTTWFEVIGMGSALQQTGSSWRFIHHMP